MFERDSDVAAREIMPRAIDQPGAGRVELRDLRKIDRDHAVEARLLDNSTPLLLQALRGEERPVARKRKAHALRRGLARDFGRTLHRRDGHRASLRAGVSNRLIDGVILSDDCGAPLTRAGAPPLVKPPLAKTS